MSLSIHGEAARLGGRFAAKGLGLAAQFGTLVLVTQALGADGFAGYALLLSVASIAAQLADFGLGRSLFRPAHRGVPFALLATRSLGFRLTTAALLLPAVLACGRHAALPLVPLALAFAGTLLFHLAILNRQQQLLRGRIAAAMLSEATPAILYWAGLLLWWALAGGLGLAPALWLYLLANAAGLALSIVAADGAEAWRAALRAVLRRRPGRMLAESLLLARRAGPVGIELFVSVASFNLPVLLAATLGDGGADAQVALYQRVLGLEVAILSVTVAARLKRYYDDGLVRRVDLRPALGSGALVFAINAGGLLLLAVLPGVGSVTLLTLAAGLRDQLWLLASVTGLIAVYVHCSMAALGGDWLWQRCASGGCGLATTIVAATLLARAGMAGLPMVLAASLAGQVVALALLLAALARGGARLQLPGVATPLRAGAH
ncbi:hypothetical protein ACBY01_09085 [Sphingomonas sp. ac-8]|uniref:hypothetical protein n=1 Tax=Sphingomonas sp. ac-8 TaxID=3242977 RepID=UPI003A7F8C91